MLSKQGPSQPKKLLPINTLQNKQVSLGINIFLKPPALDKKQDILYDNDDDNMKKTQSQIYNSQNLFNLSYNRNSDQLVQTKAIQPKFIKPTPQELFKRKYNRCEKATYERVKFYQTFHPTELMNKKYVNIEGPDWNLDFSFFAVNMLEDFADYERGISILAPDQFKLLNKKYKEKQDADNLISSRSNQLSNRSKSPSM